MGVLLRQPILRVGIQVRGTRRIQIVGDVSTFHGQGNRIGPDGLVAGIAMVTLDAGEEHDGVRHLCLDACLEQVLGGDPERRGADEDFAAEGNRPAPPPPGLVAPLAISEAARRLRAYVGSFLPARFPPAVWTLLRLSGYWDETN